MRILSKIIDAVGLNEYGWTIVLLILLINLMALSLI